jgi:hypothetical protein
MNRILLVVVLLASAASAQVVTRAGRKIMLFGGRNHDVYLGCLSCSETAGDSILNSFSNYGSSFNSNSIFNSFGAYGSRFAPTSACNQFAIYPPVVVDNRGAYYGELTKNEFRLKRVRNDDLEAWLAGVCEGH